MSTTKMGIPKELALKQNKEKKVKKEKKRQREDEEAVVEDKGKPETKKKKLSKEERKALKAEKKAEKEAALEKVPKVDEHGIAYTKIQVKRMAKRVKRGLPPVPTEEEERERIRRLKREEKETQDELAGMLHKSEVDDMDGNDDDKSQSEDDDEIIDQEDKAEDEITKDEDNNGDGVENKAVQCTKIDSRSPVKKKSRSKPVPVGYVCYACKNAHSPLHWIYDCPDKVYKPGTNKVKKSLRGLNDPSASKVFVSGLPFDAKTKEVQSYFENEMKCGKVEQCKLLLFEDSKRCKGNGFLTFETAEGAKNALKLNGTIFSLGDKKDKKAKELKLGVTKVRNRKQTKR